MANIFLNIEKGIEVGAEDLLKFVNLANSKTASGGPGAIAALGVLAGSVDKALTDVATGAANPTTLVLSLPSDVTDIKAVWPAAKSLLATLGIKI
jgi:hypothetical protein